MVQTQAGMKKAVWMSFGVVLFVVASIFMTSTASAALDGSQAPRPDSAAMGWAFLAAAISTGLACLGAGIAVGYVGAAAVGVVAEKPQMAGRTLIFVGLAEGIAIYGLIMAIMILRKV